MVMIESVKFKVRARLLEQMGEQLIKSESIALMELIKNAYDADASYCKIEMNNVSSPDEGSIIITDDGSGMSYDILRNVWLDIGTNFKMDEERGEKKRSPKYHRVQMGEKGIGRFGVHRLGHEIEIITRMEDCDECRLLINWDSIATSRYMDDFPISLEKYPPVYYKNNTGTRIIIRRLKGKWERSTVRECARAVTSLNSPFENESKFRAEIIVSDPGLLEGLINYADIDQFKLYSFEIRMAGKFITDFHYSFIPYSTMKGIEPRTVIIQDFKEDFQRQLKMKKDKELVDINLSDAKIGTIIIKGVIFDLDPRILNASLLTDKKGFKDYLFQNGGVRVFRDNLRIWDYGEPENDWLEMETRRINNPGLKISKHQILGAVYLNSGKSRDLIEKANREGFMDNTAYQLLKNACRVALGKVELLRREDKEKLRSLYGPADKKIPVISSLAEAKALISEKISDPKISREINRSLDRIQEDYDEITNRLMISAGAGLNLIIVIHQMQKILRSITDGIKTKADPEIIKQQIEDLSYLVEGYSILIKKSDIKLRNLKGILENALFNLETRLKVHDIDLEPAFRNRIDQLDGICSESYVVNSIMNLIDNSIWWIEFANKKNKSVYIDISSDYNGYTAVIVADTGPGFTISKSILGEPFVTAKPDGVGMGIGLHLTTLFMEKLGGKVLYPDYGDVKVPKKYKNGAIVVLLFKKKGDK
jgi:signal transduction histidine kinase